MQTVFNLSEIFHLIHVEVFDIDNILVYNCSKWLYLIITITWKAGHIQS